MGKERWTRDAVTNRLRGAKAALEEELDFWEGFQSQTDAELIRPKDVATWRAWCDRNIERLTRAVRKA